MNSQTKIRFFSQLLAKLLIGLLLLILMWPLFSNTLYCGDSLGEYYELVGKISKVEGKVEYFLGQVEECTELLREALANNASESVMQEIAEAKKESETNLNVEKKVLDVLKFRLESRNFDASLSTDSSLGKRRFNE